MTAHNKTIKVKKTLAVKTPKGNAKSRKAVTKKVGVKDEQRRVKKILDAVYTKVKTYDDILKTGIDYMNGKLPQTWFYGAAWGEGEDQQTHATKEATKTLIELHKKGVFTFGGQSSVCGNIDETSPYRSLNFHDGSFPVAYKQRSCIAGYIPIELAQKILPILKEDKRIYVEIKFPKDQGNFINIPYKVEAGAEEWPGEFNVTTYKSSTGKWHNYTNMSDEPHGDFVKSNPREYPAIRRILKQQAEIDVVLRQYCKGPEADKILLDAINKVI
jgi:hypothetical protein